MRRHFLLLATAAAVFAAMPEAMAMGFGQTALRTTLGQPLDFSAAISFDGDETLAPQCVFAEVRAGDARVPPPDVHASLEPARDGMPRSIRVTTTVRIDEPVATIDLTVGCNSRMSRRFVVFVDPPPTRLAEAGDMPLPPQSPPRDSQSILLGDLARAADASRRGGARSVNSGGETKDASTARAGSEGRAATASPSARRAPVRTAAATPARALRHRHGRSHLATHAAPRPGRLAAASRPRLQLDAPVAVVAPQAAASAPSKPESASLDAALAAAAAASAALQQERDRIQVLEAALAGLRNDSQATQRSVAALQARLREAESQRYPGGLVYVLAAMVVLLGFVVAVLIWLRPRQRQRARWFDAAAEQQARAARAAANDAPLGRPAEIAAPAVAATGLTSGPGSLSGIDTQPAAIGGLEVTTVLGPEAARPVVEAMRGMPGRRSGELSMEELIDLEQQAEFFAVLGQEDAAIALLEAYLRGDGGKSPLPYLQLLELQQRRGDKDAYEAVRSAFNERFHAFAPEWTDDVHYGRDLEAYPQTVARLQALWPTPLSAMQALDSLLFRRHASDDTFDFPAYRELLFLYSIARELSGHVETDFGSIDVLLPLEDAPIDLAPTTPDAGAFAVDLDVSSWGDSQPAEPFVIHRSPGRRGAA